MKISFSCFFQPLHFQCKVFEFNKFGNPGFGTGFPSQAIINPLNPTCDFFYFFNDVL